MATATKTKKPTTAKQARDAAQEITNKIIAALEKGTVPWHKEWRSVGGDFPTSLATGKLYRGSNVVTLWLAAMENGYTSKYWGTYNQMAERAGMVFDDKKKRWFSPLLEDGTVDPTPRGVRKGEKSTEIIKWLILDKPALDANGRPLYRKDGRPQMKKLFLPRIFHVFNADQCEFPAGCKGVPTTVLAPEGEEFDPIAEAEEIIHEYLHVREGHPSLRHGGDRAYYAPAKDHIQMPKRADFESAEGYYSTLFHETTHSTGATKRKNREGIREGTFGAFGDKVYSFEELVAELGAAFLCGLSGIEQQKTLDNSAAYIAHWLGKLREDKNLIIRAASQAQAAVDHILGTTFKSDEDEPEDEGVAA